MKLSAPALRVQLASGGKLDASEPSGWMESLPSAARERLLPFLLGAAVLLFFFGRGGGMSWFDGNVDRLDSKHAEG